MRLIIFLRTCDHCGLDVERTFTDTWSGKELCVECLAPIIRGLSLSPGTDEDNLNELLAELDR